MDNQQGIGCMDMKHKPILERWIRFHDCIVGYVFDSDEIPDGRRVKTSFLIQFNEWGEAVCKGGTYRLGDPGIAEEHNVPLPNGIWRKHEKNNRIFIPFIVG